MRCFAVMCRFDEYGLISSVNPPRSIIGQGLYSAGQAVVDVLDYVDRWLEEKKVGRQIHLLGSRGASHPVHGLMHLHVCACQQCNCNCLQHDVLGPRLLPAGAAPADAQAARQDGGHRRRPRAGFCHRLRAGSVLAKYPFDPKRPTAAALGPLFNCPRSKHRCAASL